jgi:hypothetical protein
MIMVCPDKGSGILEAAIVATPLKGFKSLSGGWTAFYPPPIMEFYPVLIIRVARKPTPFMDGTNRKVLKGIFFCISFECVVLMWLGCPCKKRNDARNPRRENIESASLES